jgi:hypothetical protein
MKKQYEVVLKCPVLCNNTTVVVFASSPEEAIELAKENSSSAFVVEVNEVVNAN